MVCQVCHTHWPQRATKEAEYQQYGAGRPWANRVDAVLLKAKGELP